MLNYFETIKIHLQYSNLRSETVEIHVKYSNLKSLHSKLKRFQDLNKLVHESITQLYKYCTKFAGIKVIRS